MSEFDPLGPLREYRDAAASLSKVMPDMDLQLSKHVVALNNLIIHQEEAIEEYVAQERRRVLLDARDEMRRCWSTGGKIGDPVEPNVAYSADKWLEVYANRGITDGDDD